ncbi:alpha/beta fold hydrolase [Nocardia sp. NPDC051756]|uniref:alpha/beta fold hydrolase n=1 Tax=Nocardia sp. NPDC051756 TaxID=3154751 RepID=UPI0034331A46
MAIRNFAAIARRAAGPAAPRQPVAQPQPEGSTGPLAVLVAALALAAIFAPACSRSDPQPRPEVKASVQERPASSVQWAACEGEELASLECATVQVPMDYRNPALGQIDIAISRAGAQDPQRRLGVLFTNPGGPGGAGLAMPAGYAEQPIGQVYDIIGIDVRGVGKSTNLAACAPIDETRFPVSSQSRPTDNDLIQLVEQAKAKEAACAQTGGEFRRYVTTMNTARDMDNIRGQLGESMINYLGVSYGTWLGAVYGEMFPGHLNRNVLDSSMDPRVSWREGDVNNTAATKQNFEDWATWTAERDKVFQLGATPAAVRASIDTIAEALTRHPVGGFESRDDFDGAVGEFTRYRKSWASFAKSMHYVLDEVHGAPPRPEVDKSNQHAVQTADALDDDAVTERDDEDKDMSDAVNAAVLCDWDWPTDMEVYFRDMRSARDTFPYGNTVGQLSPNACSFHTDKVEPLVKIGAPKYPRGLVVQSDGDTQTSLVDGRAMAKTLDSVLIVVHNEGAHGLYAADPVNACVNDAVNAYLLDAKLPAATVDCATADPPMPVPSQPDPANPDPEATIPLLGETADQLKTEVEAGP